MKQFALILVSLLLCLSLATAAYADGEGGAVDVIWTGTTKGPECDVTVTLYKTATTELLDREYYEMWQGFYLEMRDENGNLLLTEDFTEASKSFYLTEPGHYYFSVFSGLNNVLQGCLDDNAVYTPYVQHVEVYDMAALEEQARLDEYLFMLSDIFGMYPDDPDKGCREFLFALHSAFDADQRAEFIGYLTQNVETLGDEMAENFDYFVNHEAYSAMIQADMQGLDPSIFTDDALLFWENEGWRYIANGEQLLFTGEPAVILPYSEYLTLNQEGAEALPGEGDVPAEETAPAESGPSPVLFIGIGAVAVVVILLVLLKKKK